MFMLFNRSSEIHIGDNHISGLDISFSIEKTLTREPNNCELKVWNLNDRNRKCLRDQKRIPVMLKAGYEDSLGLLFKGDLAEAFSLREGPDWITTIRSGDGLSAFQSARINKSFKAGTPIIDILKEVAKTLGISVGDAIKRLEGRAFPGASKTLTSGTAFSGSSCVELHKLCKSIGLEASIQDNVLQILISKEALEQTAVLLSPNTGLIDSPQVSNKGILRARSLLNHELFPGRKVKVESGEIKEQLFRIERANYIGETFGQDWYVDIEAQAL